MADPDQPVLLYATDPLPGSAGLTLRDGRHMALRAAGASTPLYLDGVFDDRSLAMAKSVKPPFTGTRWKCVALPGQKGLWRLLCQNLDAYCLSADAPRLTLEVAPPDHSLRPQEWLLYRLRNHLLIRSRSGDWLGCQQHVPFCGPVDDLNNPSYHWTPETYW